MRAALVDLYEFWLGKGAAAAGVDTAEPGVALAAVGGLGRSELVPFSDLDLLLLHNGNKEVGKIADAIWYPLWDAKIGLDHSVRTPGEALKVASEDLRTAVGLLDIRHIAGDAEITGRLASAARESGWRRERRKRVGELSDSVHQRWSRSGEIAQSAEPDLKHGRGGLRDFAVLEALAVAQVMARPCADVDDARKLLLDVRTEFRRAARKPRDVLRAPDADTVAGALGRTDRFTLAR